MHRLPLHRPIKKNNVYDLLIRPLKITDKKDLILTHFKLLMSTLDESDIFSVLSVQYGLYIYFFQIINII